VGPPSNPLRTVSSNQLKAMPALAATSRNRMVVREFISEEDALERVVDRRGGDPDDDASGELMLGQPGVESRVALADCVLQRVEHCGSVPPGCGDQGTRSNASGRKNRKRSRRDRVVARLRSSVFVEDCSELLTSREIRVLARGELDVCLALGGGRSLEEQIGHLGGRSVGWDEVQRVITAGALRERGRCGKSCHRGGGESDSTAEEGSSIHGSLLMKGDCHRQAGSLRLRSHSQELVVKSAPRAAFQCRPAARGLLGPALAPMLAVHETAPERLRQLLSEEAGGTVTVRLPGASAPIRVDRRPPVDARGAFLYGRRDGAGSSRWT